MCLLVKPSVVTLDTGCYKEVTTLAADRCRIALHYSQNLHNQNN